MALRPCLEEGCPNLTTAARCHRHTRAKDKARGTRQQRGYDRTHELERERWKPTVEAGLAYCSRCDQQIRPGEPWALDHTDDRQGYRGPSHVGCNAAAGGRA